MKLSGCLDNFPVGWTNPLDLYGGHIQELRASGCDLETERHTLNELIKVYGANWVWCNRRRLVQVAKALKDYPVKNQITVHT